ncbi:MAG: hypothetical protein WA581_01360 [Candidatus Acidiferrales bacterium]
MDRAPVLQQLDRILAHPAFRHSKRYPNLLRFIVEHALNGDGHLKERTLGVAVFGRDPDYDTNEDPIVRITAGEIRKRIAQYYHEPGHESELQIDLPSGSYAPEFRMPQEFSPTEEYPHSGPAIPDASATRADKFLGRHLLIYSLIAIASITIVAGAEHVRAWTSPTALEDFWYPVLRSPASALVCVGEPNSLVHPAQRAVNFSVSDHIYDDADHIALSDANALFRLAQFLGSRGKNSRLQAAGSTSLTDLRQGPVVLVAGFDNEWTLRISQALRYHFGDSADHTIKWIADRANPAMRNWSVNFSEEYSQLTQDYAIVSRFSDPTTGEPVVIAAGLGENGTISAGEFLTDASEMQDATKNAPKNWRSKNAEVVIATQVIDGKSGPPRVVATYFW